MVNPLFLRFGSLAAVPLGFHDQRLFRRVLSVAPLSNPLNDFNSALTAHSVRCFHLSRFYCFSREIQLACLFHNVYGTNFLDNSKIDNFISPSRSNRDWLVFCIGLEAENIIYRYSTLQVDDLSALCPDSRLALTLLVVFVNTIEIASSAYSLSSPQRQDKIAFYVPILKSIVCQVRGMVSCGTLSQMTFDVDTLCSLASPHH